MGLDDLADKFGYKLLIMLFASQHLMKGFASALMGPCSSYLYKAYSVSGPQMQIYGGVTQLPWAMKPIIGLLSDALPIRGFHKAPYILISSGIGAACLALIGANVHLTVTMLVVCMFFVQLQFSTCDLLTEAKYAEKMQSNPEHGPKLMTFVWFGLQAGGFVATLMVGSMLTHFGPHFPYLVALVPASFIVVPMARNYMEEVPRSPEELTECRARLMEQKEACALCF
jgi:MFS family permease